jgi:hypothetical protein
MLLITPMNEKCTQTQFHEQEGFESLLLGSSSFQVELMILPIGEAIR